MARALSMFLGIFYDVEEPVAEPRDALDELRLALARAELAGVDDDLIDSVRAKLADLEGEVEKELRLTIRKAFSGDLLIELRVNPRDTAATLCSRLRHELDDVGVGLRLVLEDALLEPAVPLGEAGVSDGDTIFVVQTPVRCLTASLDGTARMHQLRRGECVETVVAELEGQIVSASISPVSDALLTVTSEGRAMLWCSQTCKPLCKLQGEALSCSFAADGRRLVGVADDDVARVWCADTGACLQELSLAAGSGSSRRVPPLAGEADAGTAELRFAAFSPNSELVVTCQGKAAYVWQAEGGKLLQSFVGHGEPIKFASFSPDSTLIITASADCTARLWDVATGACLRVLAGHEQEVLSATFSPNGERLLTASYDGTVRIWDHSSGECTMTLPVDNNVVNSAVFSRDGSMVLIASGSEIIRLFSCETGECCVSLSGHEDWVRSAAFSPDGALVASASFDNTARIWDVASGECVKVLTGHASALVSAEIVA